MNTPQRGSQESMDLIKAAFDKLDILQAEYVARQRAKSSLSNPILNKVREHLAEGVGYTLEALAYEFRWGTIDVLQYGYTVENTWGFPGTREHADQALRVFDRILRIERAMEGKS